MVPGDRNTFSMNFSRDVWSKVFEHTHPLDPVPAPSDETLKGETTIMGTRTPRPMGPAIPPAEAGRGSTVRYSPPVPAGGVGGETWSNHPSFSSYMMNRTVRAQTSLLVRSALMTSDVYHSPKAGGAGGCSSNPTGGMIHEGVVDRRVQGFPYEHIPAVLLSLARQGKGSYPRLSPIPPALLPWPSASRGRARAFRR
jgi:hypothetical protein